ncbi:MAG: PLP-dependent aminotransferase family protein [Dehalobacterium sp.]|jgi:GntR family transcriptional regulator/MocR family aminotransferase
MDILTFVLDEERKVPIYQQLYLWIKSEIQSGRIPPETKLPSKRKLSSYLHISQNTVQSAYNQLMEEGFITPVERKGFFVNQIDHLIQLDPREGAKKILNRQVPDNIRYDFSYHGVDPETFPFATWRKITRDVINEYDQELVRLGDPQGHLSLRTALASYLYQSRGVNCREEQIIISSGTEFLFQILIQLFDQEKIFGIENPGYEKLHVLFSSNRAQYQSLPLDEQGIKLEGLRERRVDILCVTPAHQFPSGEIMPINRRVQLLNWANRSSDRYIVEDDYDSEFKYSGKPIPALQGLDHNEKVIYMGAFSKSLSPALRVSYMVLPNHLLKRFKERLPFMICPVPVMDQKVLSKFIMDGHFERHLNKMRNVYKRKREVLVREIKKLNVGMEILGADTGLHLLLQVQNGLTEERLVALALQYGVKVYGISKYYSDQSFMGKAPQILIGFAALRENEIRAAVQVLYRAWFS